MEAKIINPFIKASLDVFDVMASVKPTPGKPYLKKDSTAVGDISGMIGFSGYCIGSIAITFEETCIIRIVTNMFGEEIKEICQDVADAVGEITNVISGYARRNFDEVGMHFDASLPSVIKGKAHKIQHVAQGPIIAIPFSTDDGGFTIEVSLDD